MIKDGEFRVLLTVAWVINSRLVRGLAS